MVICISSKKDPMDWLILTLHTLCGFKAVKPDPWPSQRLHFCCRFLQLYDKIAIKDAVAS